MKIFRILIVLASFSSLGANSLADRLITKDGNVIEVEKARQLQDGTYELTFKAGTIICPEDEIREIEIEGDMSDYVPKNENEKRKLEQGFVRYDGKWLSAQRYKNLLRDRAEERRVRLEEIEHHSEFKNAYEKLTKHFHIRTNTTPELLEYYAELLEAYYRLMDKRVGIKPTPSLRRTKMKVNIYRTREDWEEENEIGTGGGVVGYFSPHQQTLNFFYDSEDPSFTDWVALHECTHLLTYLIDPQAHARIWINEGVADFFGSSDIVRDKKGKLKILPGKIQVDRILTVQQAIKEDKYTRLEKLFKIDRGTFNAFHYAHAWSFVYFLNNHSKYEKGFRKFFKLNYTLPKSVDFKWEGTTKVVPAKEVRRLLLESIKVKDVQKLEDEWLTFIKSIDVSAPEALFKRAYINYRQGKSEEYEQAFADLNEAIEGGVETSRAYATRGSIRLVVKDGGGVDGAVKDYRRAVELDPLEAGYRINLGLLMSGQLVLLPGLDVRGQIMPKGAKGKVREEAIMHMGLAIELEPDNSFYSSLFESFKKNDREGGSDKAQ